MLRQDLLDRGLTELIPENITTSFVTPDNTHLKNNCYVYVRQEEKKTLSYIELKCFIKQIEN